MATPNPVEALQQSPELRERAIAEWARRDFREFYTHCRVITQDGVQNAEPWDHFFDPRFSPQGISLHEAIEEGTRTIVILKARQLGVTTFVAARNLWDAQFTTRMPIQVFSQGEKEAQEFLRKSRFMHDMLPESLRVEYERPPSLAEMEFIDGGRVMAFPATEMAGRSYTSWRSVFDENAFHAYARANFQAAAPQSRQVLLISTANGDNFFAEKFWAAWHGDSNDIAIFYPWDVHPGRDADWYANERKKYPYDADFLQEFPSTPHEAFQQREGLVYPMFNPALHVTHADPWPYRESKVRVAGIDFGGGDPTAVVVLGQSGNGQIHQFAEGYWREPVGIEDLVDYLGRHGPFHKVLCDPSQPTVIQSLRAAGVNAEGATNRREAIMLTAELLTNRRLTIADTCTECIKEFAGYRWRERLDPNSRDRYATSTPVENHADGMDARRYALVYLLGRTLRPQHIVYDVGHRRATHYV